MNSKEALERLYSYCTDYDMQAECILLCKEELETIKKDLEVLDKLKDPYEEEETEEYLRQSQWYWNEYLNELCCGTTIYKWTGNYKETNNKLNIPLKLKEWNEVFHTGTASAPVSLEQYFRHKEALDE